MPSATAEYPRELERCAVLRDGSHVRIRPIRPDDESRLVALFTRLSPQTVYQRFFTMRERLPAEWYRQFANVDYRSRLALVAERDTASGATIVGVARWEPADTPGSVEIAVVIEDAWQGRGLGAVLLDDLLEAADARGIRTFAADVLAENQRMLRLLGSRTRILRSSAAYGVITLTFMRRADATRERESADTSLGAAALSA